MYGPRSKADVFRSRYTNLPPFMEAKSKLPKHRLRGTRTWCRGKHFDLRGHIQKEWRKLHNEELYRKTEGLETALLNNPIFWDVTPRPQTSSSRRFEIS